MYKYLLLFTLPLWGMQPDSPRKPTSPKELAVVLSIKIFDRQDEDVIAAFSQILTRDRKGNVALLELRYRAVQLLEQEKTLKCGEKL
jgi:hypothetical protein